MVWNKNFKKWNRQYILCCIKPLENYMLLVHLWLNVNPRRLCRNPRGHPASVFPCQSRVWLTPGWECCPHFHKIHRDGKGQRHNHNCDSFAPCQTGLDWQWRALIFHSARKNPHPKNLSTFVYFCSWHREEEKTNRLKKLILDRPGIKNKRRYYGVRMAKVERDLWRSSGPNPTLRHDNSGLCPDNFRISPRMETPQPLWAGKLWQCSETVTVKKGSLLFIWKTTFTNAEQLLHMPASFMFSRNY